MAPPRWVKKADFARICGVTGGAINQATKPGKCLADAVSVHGTLNAAHPACIAYAESKKANAALTPQIPTALPGGGEVHEIPEEIRHLTLGDISEKYGGVASFKAHLDALDKHASYMTRKVNLDIKRNRHVDRRTVEAALFSLVDLAFRRLTDEMPLSVISQVVPAVMSKGKGARLECEAMVRDETSKILKACKDSVVRELARLVED